MRQEVYDLIYRLQGSCEPWPTDETELWTYEDWQDFDNEIFLCDQCGWWWEAGDRGLAEYKYENICRSCEEENDESVDV